jgi:hypothetical protein
MARSRRVEAASAEFASAELGDAWLTRRLMAIADTVATAPGDSFPRAASGDGEFEGVYRFVGEWDIAARPHFFGISN